MVPRRLLVLRKKHILNYGGDKMIRYSENGFWVERTDDVYRIGLSPKGQDDLGTVSFVEISADDVLDRSEPFLSVEAAKAVTDLLPPLNAQVVEWHKDIEDNPDLLNREFADSNWIVKVSDVNEEEYLALSEQDVPFVD